MTEGPSITRNDERSRYELADDPRAGYLEFERDGDRLTLVHTQVDEDREGEGLGSALVRSALADAEEQGLAVVPACDFVAGWLQRHPDRAAELDIVTA